MPQIRHNPKPVEECGLGWLKPGGFRSQNGISKKYFGAEAPARSMSLDRPPFLTKVRSQRLEPDRKLLLARQTQISRHPGDADVEESAEEVRDPRRKPVDAHEEYIQGIAISSTSVAESPSCIGIWTSPQRAACLLSVNRRSILALTQFWCSSFILRRLIWPEADRFCHGRTFGV